MFLKMTLNHKTSVHSRGTQVEVGERRSDDLEAALRGRLREWEAELSPVDAIFLYQLLAGIGDIADNAEKVAHRAQIIATS